MIKAVIFDIDETLIKENSWSYLTEKFGLSVEENFQIYSDYYSKKISLEQAIKGVIDHWNSNGIKTKNDIEKFLNLITLKPDAQDIVDYLKRKGYILCIISGAVEQHVEKIAKKLNIEIFYSLSKLEFNEKDELIAMEYEPDEVQGKVEKFQIFAKRFQLKPKECAIVGDGNSDVGLFKLLGTKILVRKQNNKNLEKYVDHTIDNLSEIRNIS